MGCSNLEVTSEQMGWNWQCQPSPWPWLAGRSCPRCQDRPKPQAHPQLTQEQIMTADTEGAETDHATKQLTATNCTAGTVQGQWYKKPEKAQGEPISEQYLEHTVNFDFASTCSMPPPPDGLSAGLHCFVEDCTECQSCQPSHLCLGSLIWGPSLWHSTLVQSLPSTGVQDLGSTTIC
eukprot:1565572-Rhodomonas_salina.4